MSDHSKKKRFLNTPKYPGGSAAFRAFISTSLRYPDEALKLGIEGSVIVGYDVHDTGLVSNLHIIKGLGHGCDEEAIRVISLLRFEKVKNRGLRLTMSTKTTIHFKLPGVTIRYALEYKEKTPAVPAEPVKPPATSYEYTITF